jgi:tripartite-type tricarboxylate transporter receptor subunit TctC
LPVRSVRDLIVLARQRPGELAFGSAGVGSTTHLAGEYFRRLARIETVHVPYKGSSQAEIDLATGQVQYMIDSAPAALPNIKAGRTRAIATTGARRFPPLGDVPTVAESGLPQYESVSWWGIIGPAGIAAPVVERLNSTVTRIMSTPDVKTLLLAQGAEATTSTPGEFMDYMKREIALYTKVIKEAGIKVE